MTDSPAPPPADSSTEYPLVPVKKVPPRLRDETTAAATADHEAGEALLPPPPPGNAALPGPPPAPRPRRRRRRILKLTGLLLLICLGLFLVRDAWLGPLLAHVGGVLLSAELGVPVEITAVSGSYFTNVTAHGVRIRGTAANAATTPPRELPLREAYLGAVTLRYNLLAWVRGDDDWIRDVHIRDATATLDLRYLEADPEAEVALPEALPVAQLPVVRAENARVTLKVDEQTWVRLDGLAAQGTPVATDPDVRYHVRVTARQLGGEVAGQALPTRDFEARVVLQERDVVLTGLRSGSEWLVGAAETLPRPPGTATTTTATATERGAGYGTSSASSFAPVVLEELQRLPGMRVELLPEQNALRVSGDAALFGGTVAVRDTLIRLGPGGPVIDADVVWQRLRLAPLAEYAGLAAALPVSLSGRLDGTLAGRVDTAAPAASEATLQATVWQARVAGVEVPRATVHAALFTERGPEVSLVLDVAGASVHAELASRETEPLRQWLAAHGVVLAGNDEPQRDALVQPDEAVPWPPLEGEVRLEVADVAALRNWLASPEVLRLLGPGTAEQLLGLNWSRLRGAEFELTAELTSPVHTATASDNAADAPHPELLLHGRFAGPDGAHLELGPLLIKGEPADWLASEVTGDVLAVVPRLEAVRAWHPRLAELAVGGALRTSVVTAGTLRAPQATLTLTAEQLTVAGAPPLEAELVAEVDAAGLVAVRQLEVRSQTQDRLRAVFVADARATPPRLEQFYLDAQVRELGEYAGLLGLSRDELAGRVLVRTTGAIPSPTTAATTPTTTTTTTTAITGPLEMPEVHVSVAAWRLRIAGFSVPEAQARLRARQDRATLEAAHLRTTQGTLELAAVLDWHRAAELNLELQRLYYAWRGLHLELEQPARVRLEPRGPEAQQPSSLAEALPVLEFVAPLRLVGPLGTVTISGGWPRDQAGDVLLAATLTDLRFLAPLLAPDTPRPVAEHFEFAARITREEVALTAQVDSLRPSPEAPPLYGVLKARFAQRRLDVEELLVSWRTPGALAAQPSTFTLTASLPLDPFAPPGPATLPGAELASPDTAVAPPLAVQARLNVGDFAWAHPWLPRALIPQGTLLATFDAAGTWANPEAHLIASTGPWQFNHLTAEELEAVSDAFDFTPAQAAKLPLWQYLGARLEVRYLDQQLAICNTHVRVPGAEAHFGLEGDVDFPFSVRNLLLGQPLEPPGEGELRFAGRIPDLDTVPVPLRDVRAVAGSLDWAVSVDAGVVGEPWQKPHLGGDANLRNANLIVQGLPPITALGLHLDFDERRLVFADGRALMGAAPLIITPGSFVGLPYEDMMELDLTLDGTNALLIREQAVRVRSDLAVTLKGVLPLTDEAHDFVAQDPQRDLAALAGEVVIRESRIVRVVDLFGIRGGGGGGSALAPDLVLFSVEAEPFSRVRLDQLRLRTGTGEFISVESNLFSGEVRVGLVLTGTLELPRPVGTATLVDGRLRLPTTTLSVESALATFEEAAPFDPQITAFARTRMLGYDISVSFNSPYSRLGEADFAFASDPPLPPTEVALLVLTGKPPEDALTADTATAAAQRLAIYFGRDILGLLFGADPTLDPGFEEFLDRIEIETGRHVSRTGVETIEVRFLLWEDLLTDNDRIYIEGERDIYDEFNAGLTIRLRLR